LKKGKARAEEVVHRGTTGEVTLQRKGGYIFIG